MKKGIVLYLDSLNIGDDIQGYAASMLAGEDYIVLDREHLDEPDDKEPTKLICNGWFMDQPQHWPPATNIEPLFISFHIGKHKLVKQSIIDSSLKPYYEQFSPIGCRDYETLKLFKQLDVDAYFSGCLTLTLPKSTAKRNNTILVVDPFINNLLDEDYIKDLIYKLIPESYHSQIRFMTHVRKNNNLSFQERLKEAEELLAIYGSARMVITSRIHCALPCLALDTPVYFMDVGYSRKSNRDRFDGILELFHVLKPNLPFHGNRIRDKVIKFFELHKLFLPSVHHLRIDWDTAEANPQRYKKIAKDLKNRVVDFIKG